MGLIFGGTLVGPFVLGWINPGGLVGDLGAIGILWLMFLTGVSFNIKAFIENRTNAIVYGLLGFFIPFELDWHREDAVLAFAVVQRLRRSKPVPLVVVTANKDIAVGEIGQTDSAGHAHAYVNDVTPLW